MIFRYQLFIFGLASLSNSDAFSVQPVTTTIQTSPQLAASSSSSEDNGVESGFSRRSFIGAATAASILAVRPLVASADTIKTMDFSLPSYDTISDARAGSDQLTQEENILTGTVVKKSSAPKKSKAEGGGGAFNVGGTPMTPEEKERLAKDKAAARQAAEAEKAAIAAEKQAERDAIAAEKAAEKAAKDAERAAQKAVDDSDRAAKQAAAKAAKEQQAKAAEEKQAAKAAASKFSSADFVDMALPSYSDSASTGKEKSVFSL